MQINYFDYYYNFFSEYPSLVLTSPTLTLNYLLFLPQLLPNLYHLGAASREEVNGSSLGPIQEKLESMAGEVTNVMDQQLQVGL